MTIRKVFIPGEHDWYLDMGEKWTELFGQPNWTFDHKGVRFVGLDTVSRGPDYWTAKKMTPKERMGHMATLDGSVAGAWAGVGRDQLQWLNQTLSNWPKDKPVIVFTHNPLYEYYPPWNFWVRDWREVHEVLKPYTNVTNIHGHTHQVLYNEIGKMRSIGMLATSWTWPYPPAGRAGADQVHGAGRPGRPLRRRRLGAADPERSGQGGERVHDVAEGHLRRGPGRLRMRGQRQSDPAAPHRRPRVAVLRRLQVTAGGP